MSTPSDEITAYRLACRDGDDRALVQWIVALENEGNLDAASLLRRVPPAIAEINLEVEKWRLHGRKGSINLHSYPEDAWWFCGDWERGHSEEGDTTATLIGDLLRDWNTYLPAIEYIARKLGLLQVECELDPQDGGTRNIAVRFALNRGEHLGPLPANHVVAGVYCNEI